MNRQKMINDLAIKKHTATHDNIDIRKQIESYRDGGQSTAVNAKGKVALSEANSKAIIESLKRKVVALQEENKELKRQLEVAYSDYYNSR